MQERDEQVIKKRSIRTTWIQTSVIPAFLLGVILVIISVNALMDGITHEISRSLEVAALSLSHTYSLVAPGDYALEDGILKKGDKKLSGDYSIVDEMKKVYNMELTLFYGDRRVLTTIIDRDGNRVIDTKASKEVVDHVLERGDAYFSKKVNISGGAYYGYYVPIKNQNGQVVGMAFAGKSSEVVMQSVLSSILQSVLVSLLVIAVSIVCCVMVSHGVVDSLHAIMEYLGFLAQSDFTKKMPQKVVGRKDEIGEMGRSAVIVSQSLKEMVTIDSLTGLSNRRTCGKYLLEKIEACEKSHRDDITVAIADIDFFKKINDCYGHECGDRVLVAVAEVFSKHMGENGIVSRWGGEEFLFVFEKPIAQSKHDMQAILNEIRGMDFQYEEKHFGVTLSAGMNGNIVGHNFDKIVKLADDMLYQGKEGGRNRIVTNEGEVILPDKQAGQA